MLYETVSAIPGLFFNIYSFKHAKDQIKQSKSKSNNCNVVSLNDSTLFSFTMPMFRK